MLTAEKPANIEIGSKPLHVVVDMQQMFVEGTAWSSPSPITVLPNIERLCSAFATSTVFMKFMVPASVDHAPRRWRTYYERWQELTLEIAHPSIQEIVGPLRRFLTSRNQFEKYTFSAFGSPQFKAYLVEADIDTLIFSGVETDMCVYASVVEAIDRGFQVLVVEDAVTSSDIDAHHATLRHLLPRLPEFVGTITTEAAVDIASSLACHG